MAERIHKAIIAVMREIGAIGKDRENVQQKYKYRGIEDVYNRCQPIMAKHGIFSVPQVIDTKQETGKSKSGGQLTHVTLTVTYSFFAEDGSHVDVTVVGQGMDSGDKAAAKAQTSAHKTAICQLLNIPFQQVDIEKFSPEYFSQYNERVSMRDLGELKREWHASIDANGKSKDELAKMFTQWATEKTGHEFDVSDPRHWTRDDLLTCKEAVAATVVETDNAD